MNNKNLGEIIEDCKTGSGDCATKSAHPNTGFYFACPFVMARHVCPYILKEDHPGQFGRIEQIYKCKLREYENNK